MDRDEVAAHVDLRLNRRAVAQPRGAGLAALAALALVTAPVHASPALPTVDATPAGGPVAAPAYVELSTPDFVLLAPQDATRAQALAAQVLAFRRALESLLGTRLEPSLPTTIFALEGPDWTRYAEPRPGMAGYFVAHPFSADLMFNASTPGRQPVELMLHEYTHLLLRALGPLRLPPFLDEGLAEVLSTAQFAPRAVRFPIRAHHQALLRQSTWLPFERLVETRRRDAHYLELSRAPLFYAQSWATLFYALSADEAARRRMPAYLDALRAGVEGPAAVAAAEGLLGLPAERVNEAVARFVLARPAPSTIVVRLPREAGTGAVATRRIARDEYEVRLGELLLRLGNRATLARALFRAVPEDSAFAARARVGAALSVLQSGDLQFAAALLDAPDLADDLDAASVVQLARGLLQLSLPSSGAGPESGLDPGAEASRLPRLARARALFTRAMEAPCCWLEATHGYVVATLALQQPEPGLLERALRAQRAAPANTELAVAVALVHETEGRAAQARVYWEAAARGLQWGPARSRILERLRRDAPAPDAPQSAPDPAAAAAGATVGPGG